MSMELRPVDDININVHDETGRIGYIHHIAADHLEEDDNADLVGWHVCLGPFIATLGSREVGPYSTLAEAIEGARGLYEELLIDRRYVRRVDRNRPRTVSIPRGGQPKA